MHGDDQKAPQNITLSSEDAQKYTQPSTEAEREDIFSPTPMNIMQKH